MYICWKTRWPNVGAKRSEFIEFVAVAASRIIIKQIVLIVLKQGPIKTRRGSRCCGNDEGEKVSKKSDKSVDQTVFDHFERASDEEPNCSEVMVDPDMRPEDVARIVLEKVNRK